MTESEDNEKGVLTIDVNYAKFAQHLNGAIHFLTLIRQDLEKAALNKKVKEDNGEWP